MDLNYASGSDSDEKNPPKKAKTSMALVNSAPGVVEDLVAMQSQYIDPTSKELISNPRAEALWRPIEGPAHPYKATNIGHSQGIVQNSVLGFVEKTAMNEYSFDEQYNTFTRFGYAHDPSENSVGAFVGNADKVSQFDGRTVTSVQRLPRTQDQRERRRKRKEENCDVENPEDYQGPWASYYHEEEEVMPEPTAEQKEWAAKIEEKKKKDRRGEMGGEAAAAALEEEEEAWETSTFHGNELYDYQGRSYVHSSAKPRASNLQCYIPKKCLHTWAGHSKGVSSIKFFPHTGHLLLSSSMDGTCKIWDVHNQRKCLRTYEGHTEAVRAVDFSPDGKRFISCSYDRFVKVWDTETGQCISRHTTKKIPFCIKWFPEEGGHENEFLCGQSNKLVVQWDIREKKVVQQYDEHLGPVNSITFLDNNKRFLSSSDDKKILIWEYGIPVVVKHLAEPEMHSMPFTTMHPNGKFFLGQSQDNQILVHAAHGRYKVNTKKRFRGHLTAGYACQMDFSPDGKYLMSGDAEGRVFFWEWRTSRLFSKFKAHDKVTIGAAWHPLESSKVATCSWDGTIKYWD